MFPPLPSSVRFWYEDTRPLDQSNLTYALERDYATEQLDREN